MPSDINNSSNQVFLCNNGYWPNEYSIRQWSRRSRFNPKLSHTKDSKTKMVLDAALLNTHHYKVQIKGKVEKSRESSSTFPYTSMK